MNLIGVSRLVWKVLLVGLAVLVMGLGWVGLKKGGNDMAVLEMELVEEVSVPTIDIAAPIETETATFALG
jgi:hypothetical protein